MGHLDSQRSLPVFDPDPGGFSSLAKKFRLNADHTVAVLNAPEGYVEMLHPGPAAMTTQLEPAKAYDAVVLFVSGQDELRRLGPEAVHAAKPNALLWIAFPKGDATDLPRTPSWVERDVFGELTTQAGYKPVAFVAVDEAWTAMRFKRV